MDLERRPSKAWVTGSSPVRGTKKNEKKNCKTALIFEKKVVSLQPETELVPLHKKVL